MMRQHTTLPFDDETSKIMTDLGFMRIEERVYVHRGLPEAGRLDLTAVADEHFVNQALRWMEASASARGRKSLREAIMGVLG